ncbi:hypothetical protein AAVH_12315 [Aphelenchoides avenae]|nr:hypothetical protein AAVH_12315 [Aphelenchus avenae]
MYRCTVLLAALLCTCQADVSKKYLHVEGVYKCNFKPIAGESVVILHRQAEASDWYHKIAETHTDEQGNYDLQASDDVCENGCDGPIEKGFYVQLSHHCFEDRNPHNMTLEIPKENEGDSANGAKLFKQDFLINHL